MKGVVLRWIVLPTVLLYGALVGVGWLLAKPLAEVTAGEDAVSRGLTAHRDPVLNVVTAAFSYLANTFEIIGAAAICMLILRWTLGRWAEALMIATAVALEAAVFLATTLLVDRPRPEVSHLDIAPPTSSFPSGHTGAAVALYCGLAFVVWWQVRRPGLRGVVLAVLVAIPFCVGISRLYRGMHHPTDVVFGALNGLCCLLIAVYAYRRMFPAIGSGAGSGAPSQRTPPRSAARAMLRAMPPKTTA